MSTTNMTAPQNQSALDAFMEWMRRQRESAPVYYDEQNRMWHLFGYADNLRVLSDPMTFSSDLSKFMPQPPELELFSKGNFVRMDPPKHRKLRDLVSQVFTPRMVSGLAPRISELTSELLDDVGDDVKRFDLVESLAYPLPVIVIAEMLGIPVTDRELFRTWADKMLSTSNNDNLGLPDAETLRRVIEAMGEMNSYLLAHIKQRRTAPTEDLIGKLTTAEVDGHRLDDDEIVGFVGLLLIAGHITTTALLGNSILCLDESPAAAAELRADPSGIPPAIEEVLRYRSPFPRLGRWTNKDVELSGTRIPADQLVLLWVGSANRDGAQFKDPDRFDIHRKPNPHLSFGHGIHFCLGAPLARLESKIALEILFERYRSIRVAYDANVELQNPRSMISVKRLPIDVEVARPKSAAALRASA